jgi:hypothetical protein
MRRDRIDGRGVGTAINHRLKPHFVRSTFDSCRDDAIEGTAVKGHQETFQALPHSRKSVFNLKS